MNNKKTLFDIFLLIKFKVENTLKEAIDTSISKYHNGVLDSSPVDLMQKTVRNIL
jgi:hypothetical protein